MALSGGMMWGNCDIVWGIVGTLGVGGTLGYGGSNLGSDEGETVDGTGRETERKASAKMVAK